MPAVTSLVMTTTSVSGHCQGTLGGHNLAPSREPLGYRKGVEVMQGEKSFGQPRELSAADTRCLTLEGWQNQVHVLLPAVPLSEVYFSRFT